MSNLYRGPSIDASYQVSVHLVEGFQRHISVIQFRYLEITAFWIQISIFKQELSFFLQRRRFFKNQPIRNKNCLWRPCLLMDQDEMSNLYRGPSIDAAYQVSVHLAEGFQRRRLKYEKLTDDRRRTPDAKWWQKLTLPLARWAKNTGNIKVKKSNINPNQ